MSFLKDLFTAFGKMILKLVGSRKAVFQTINTMITCYLIYSLTDELYRIYVFIIFNVANMSYMGIIQYESIKTNINLGGQ